MENYNKLLEKAQKAYKNCITGAEKRRLESIFPELKMSEDERIRKEIIEFLQLPHRQFVGERNQEEWIEWLQKQSKQNSTPKFKVGDWVVFNNNHYSVYQIEKIENYEYTLRHILGGSMCLSFSHENMIRAWTIEDAKDGDVLDADGAPFIYKKHNKYCVYFYCGINLTDEFVEANGTDIWSNNDKVYPATKEQCALLFSKMREKGYEWNANKKELKKIEKNPAWSEEDELRFKQAIYVCHRNGYTDVENWLKYLKPQPQWKPTVDQMQSLYSVVITYSKKDDYKLTYDSLNSLYDDLKKL